MPSRPAPTGPTLIWIEPHHFARTNRERDWLQFFLHLVTGLALLLLSESVFAQIYRCKDANGQTVIQQFACDAETTVRRPMPSRGSPPAFLLRQPDPVLERPETDEDDGLSPSERVAERRRQEWKARRDALEGREAADQAFNRERHQAAIEERERIAAKEEAEREKRDRELAQSLGRRPQVTHLLKRSPAPAKRGPPQLVNCDPGGCWATDGRRFNRGGNGPTYFGSDGTVCTHVGGTALHCN